MSNTTIIPRGIHVKEIKDLKDVQDWIVQNDTYTNENDAHAVADSNCLLLKKILLGRGFPVMSVTSQIDEDENNTDMSVDIYKISYFMKLDTSD